MTPIILCETAEGCTCDIVTRLDTSLTKAGQAMAEDTEKWLREETR